MIVRCGVLVGLKMEDGVNRAEVVVLRKTGSSRRARRVCGDLRSIGDVVKSGWV